MSDEPIPNFTSEQEEAAWWEAQPEALTYQSYIKTLLHEALDAEEKKLTP
jgi:hypothetical protein